MLHHMDARVGLAVFSVVLAAAMLAYPASTEQSRHDVGVHVNGSADELSVGLSVDRDALDFGNVPRTDMDVRKELTVENTRAYPATIQVHVTGNISDHVTVTDEEVRLTPGQTHTTEITFHASDSLDEGYHGGELVVYARRPLYQVVLGTIQRAG